MPFWRPCAAPHCAADNRPQEPQEPQGPDLATFARCVRVPGVPRKNHDRRAVGIGYAEVVQQGGEKSKVVHLGLICSFMIRKGPENPSTV